MNVLGLGRSPEDVYDPHNPISLQYGCIAFEKRWPCDHNGC